MIVFEAKGRRIMFELPLPDREEKRFQSTDAANCGTPAKRLEAREQACRQRWRALALVIKAKLEAVESGRKRIPRSHRHARRADGRGPCEAAGRRRL
jgi:hypothetical protein